MLFFLQVSASVCVCVCSAILKLKNLFFSCVFSFSKRKKNALLSLHPVVGDYRLGHLSCSHRHCFLNRQLESYNCRSAQTRGICGLSFWNFFVFLKNDNTIQKYKFLTILITYTASGGSRWPGLAGRTRIEYPLLLSDQGPLPRLFWR